MIANKIKNEAETETPMIPPTRLKSSNFELMADDVAATTSEVIITTVEWPSEKKKPTVTGRWPDASRRRVIRSIALLTISRLERPLQTSMIPKYGQRQGHVVDLVYTQGQR